MTLEVARASLGVADAILVSVSTVGLRNRAIARWAVSLTLGALFLAPHLDELTGWLLVGAVATAQALMTLQVYRVEETAPADAASAKKGSLLVPAVLASLCAVLAVALLQDEVLGSGWSSIVDPSSRWFVVAGGGLLATLGYGVVVEVFVARISAGLHDVQKASTRGGAPQAGRIIGWLERLGIFSVILLGAPQAIVAVLGLKSLARLPQFKDEAFGEYFLIGTLLSTIGAAGIGVITRAALGLSLL